MFTVIIILGLTRPCNCSISIGGQVIRSGSAVGPNGKAGTTQLSFTHFPDASLGVSF